MTEDVQHGDVLYKQFEDGSIEAVGELHVRALCEQNILIFRPNVLYRFEPIPGCEACANIAFAYKDHS